VNSPIDARPARAFAVLAAIAAVPLSILLATDAGAVVPRSPSGAQGQASGGAGLVGQDTGGAGLATALASTPAHPTAVARERHAAHRATSAAEPSSVVRRPSNSGSAR